MPTSSNKIVPYLKYEIEDPIALEEGDIAIIRDDKAIFLTSEGVHTSKVYVTMEVEMHPGGYYG